MPVRRWRKQQVRRGNKVSPLICPVCMHACHELHCRRARDIESPVGPAGCTGTDHQGWSSSNRDRELSGRGVGGTDFKTSCLDLQARCRVSCTSERSRVMSGEQA